MAADVAVVRRFSRFYTRRIGVLEDGLLGSGLTLPQARLIYEIANAQRHQTTPGVLAAQLGLDAGYVSRLVAGLEARDLVEKAQSTSDGRSSVVTLTPQGHRAYRAIDARSAEEAGQIIGALDDPARRRIVQSMLTIERDLGGAPHGQLTTIRDPRPGDMGFVVHRHGALYNLEYGWDWTFEALVARVVADYVEHLEPTRDCCRIAEADGRVVGSAFVVRSDRTEVAKLRLVYVEPTMRGTGLGQALVEACMHFAREAGYRRMTLWTNDVLVPARRLYQRLGFEMVSAEPLRAFGHDLVAETWERDL